MSASSLLADLRAARELRRGTPSSPAADVPASTPPSLIAPELPPDAAAPPAVSDAAPPARLEAPPRFDEQAEAPLVPPPPAVPDPLPLFDLPRLPAGHVINRGAPRRAPTAVRATPRRGTVLKPVTAGELLSAHWRTGAMAAAWLGILFYLGGKYGILWCCATVLLFIVTHLSNGRRSVFSSYSIFNPNFERSLGQLTTGDFDRMVLGRETAEQRRGVIDDVTTSSTLAAARAAGHVLGGGVEGSGGDERAHLDALRRERAAGGGGGGGGGDDEEDDAALQEALSRSLREQ